MTAPTADLLDAGLYTVPMAARFLGAKSSKVRSWVDGYNNSDAQPILVKQAAQVGGKTVLSFLDLIESAFVRHFRAIGYSSQTIRKVAFKLRQRHGVDHPFATNKRFKADGKDIFEEVVADDGERRLVSLMNDNFMIVSAIEPSLFDQVFYVDDIAREFTPLHDHPDVTMNPNISFGRPVVKSIWIPTETLFTSYLNEGGEDAVAEEFGIVPEAVLTAVKFEQALESRTIH